MFSTIKFKLEFPCSTQRPARKYNDGQLWVGQGFPCLRAYFNVPEAVSSRIFSGGSYQSLHTKNFLIDKY
jgi:hypothetical protein